MLRYGKRGAIVKKDDYVKLFWRQYKLCEKELINTADYVSISPQNNDTFSNQYQKIFFCVCSELDAVASELCGEEKTKNFPQRMSLIFNKDKSVKFKRVTTKFPYDTINLVPFDNFKEDENGQLVSARWWQDYNDLKHNRSGDNGSGRFNFQNANLENTLLSLAALYILNVELSKKCGLETLEDKQLMKSNLFYIN